MFFLFTFVAQLGRKGFFSATCYSDHSEISLRAPSVVSPSETNLSEIAGCTLFVSRKRPFFEVLADNTPLAPPKTLS